MAFSECRMRLTALEVNFSICVSDKGWTTSDNRNTFFLPLAPVILKQNKFTQGHKTDLHKEEADNTCALDVGQDSLGLSRRNDGFREPLDCGRGLCGNLFFFVTPHHRDGLSHHHSRKFALDEQVFGPSFILVVFACIVFSGFALLQS